MHVAVRPIEIACIRSLGSQATIAMHRMLPTVAGMTTNEIIKGSSKQK